MRTHVIESTGGGVSPTRNLVHTESVASARWASRLPSFGALCILLQGLLPAELRADEETDEALLLGIQAGDRRAFAQLYARYAGPLRVAAACLVKDSVQAEDLLHDVFCESWKCAPSYDPARSSVRTWLLIRLRSRAIDRFRRSSARRGAAVREGRRMLRHTASADTPETSYLALVLNRRMTRLPAAQQKLLDLVFFQDLSLCDVATELGCPVGTVKSRLHRLLQRLAGKPPQRRAPSPSSRQAA